MSMHGWLRYCTGAGMICAVIVYGTAVSRAAIITPYFNDFSASEPFTENGASWNLDTGAGTYTNTFSTNGTSSSATAAVTDLGGSPATALDFVMSSKFTITANSGNTANNTVGFAALSSSANPSANWLLADVGTNGVSAIIRLLRFNNSSGNATISQSNLGALTTGTEYTMTLTGNYTPANNLDLLLTLYNGSTLVASTSGTVLSTDVTANLTGNNFGLRNRTNTGATFAVAFNDFSITTPVPEPSTWALGAASLAGLFIWRRRAAA